MGVVGAALVGFTAACGGSGTTSNVAVQVWALVDPQNEPVIQQGVDEFNKNSSVKAEFRAFPNAWYKLKLQTAIDALNTPDVFLNWGGASLAQYVKEGLVADLTPTLRENPDVANAFLPSVLEVGKVDGKQYGLPMNGIQPVLLFYNKAVFDQAGVQPPQTFDDLLTLVDEFKKQGIVPIALPGTQTWTMLMWLEYLLDRIGGPEKFEAIAAGKDGAWADPAVRRALELCQELVRRGAFGDNFASITYDAAGSPRMLAKGEAAMILMGSWEYPSQLSYHPDFVASGNLGWTTFPTVPGGTGDPKNVVGNPSNYFSVRADRPATKAAIEFLMRTLTSESHINALIKSGQVPAVKGVESKLAGTDTADFTTFTYKLVAEAPSFTQSWDQALPSTVANEMLENLRRLFLLEITPDEFVQKMEAVS
ncbi:MAG TPA: extracellular solute-binding protein [Micromonospora sp.]